MAVINYGYGDMPVEASIWTLSIYEHEFHSDLIQDFYGRIEAEEEEDGSGTLLFNYRDTNWFHCFLGVRLFPQVLA